MFWDELRRRLRGGRWYTALLIYVAVLSAIFIFSLILMPPVDEQEVNAGNGAQLILYVLIGQFTLLTFMVPALTTNAVAKEREKGTLESLFETPISTCSILLGKYFGALGHCMLVLLAGCPFYFLICLFWPASFMGVAYFGTIVLSLVIYAAFYAAIGLLCSCYCQRVATAIAWSYGAVLFLLAIKLVNLFSQPFFHNMLGSLSATDSLKYILPFASSLLFGQDPLNLTELVLRHGHYNRTFFNLLPYIIDTVTLLSTMCLLWLSHCRLNRLRAQEGAAAPPLLFAFGQRLYARMKKFYELPPVDEPDGQP